MYFQNHSFNLTRAVVVSGDLYQRPLCPFASKPWKQDKVKLVVSDSTCEEKLLQSISLELEVLFPSTPLAPSCKTSSPAPDTTLIIAPLLFQNDYRQMIHFSWKVMEHISTQSHLIEKVQVSDVQVKAQDSSSNVFIIIHYNASSGIRLLDLIITFHVMNMLMLI